MCKKRAIDANNVVSRKVPNTDDINTLPSLQTKYDEVEEPGNVTMHDLLNTPPLMMRTIINDESTISSNLTMDT